MGWDGGGVVEDERKRRPSILSRFRHVSTVNELSESESQMRSDGFLSETSGEYKTVKEKESKTPIMPSHIIQ